MILSNFFHKCKHLKTLNQISFISSMSKLIFQFVITNHLPYLFSHLFLNLFTCLLIIPQLHSYYVIIWLSFYIFEQVMSLSRLQKSYGLTFRVHDNCVVILTCFKFFIFDSYSLSLFIYKVDKLTFFHIKDY